MNLPGHSAWAQPAPLSPGEPASAPGVTYQPGAFVAPDAGAAGRDERVVPPDAPGFSAVWSNADVATVVNMLVGEFLGLDYVIAPGVGGTVTLRVDNVRTRREALAPLRAALAPLAISVTESGDLITVAQASAGGAILAGDVAVIAPGEPAPGGAGAVIIAPRNIAPSEAARLIGPLAPGVTIGTADDARRVLLVSGNSAALTAASQAVALLDVDWFTQVSTGVFPLSHVGANQLAAELRDVMGPGVLGAEIIPVPRLSSLIVLAQAPQALAAASEWIRRLDVPAVRSVASGLLVYEARYANASSLAASLRRIMSQSDADQGAESAESGSRLSNLVMQSTLSQTSGLPAGLGAGVNVGGGAFSTPASAAGASEAAAPESSAAAAGSGLVVTADTNQNLLVARGNEAQIAEVEALLQSLDRPRAQVLIEATIVEVTLTDDLRYGVNWAGLLDNELEVRLSDSGAGGVVSRFPGLSVTYLNTDIEAVLNLLASKTKVEVVSRPSVIALHNETALLQIGDQVPIITQSAVSVMNPDAPIVNQTTYRDTGVILAVTPLVLAGGVVEVEILQEVSDVAETTTSNIDSPTITQRKIESKLLVPSGEAVALGGLISASRSTGTGGVPIFMDAPLIGPLFRSTSNSIDRTELIVFLTPRILRDPSEAVDVTTHMRAALSRLEAEFLLHAE